MGIQGLLPLLHEASERKHLAHYAGQTLAVDAFVWLHRGLCTCAQEVATGQPTLKYVNYAMDKIRMLQYFGITPYVVFDGANLPSKQHTETDRAQRRADALAQAKTLVAQGQSAAARDYFLKACDVTPQMAFQMIKQLQKNGISYVVAPYEADAQLCYLEKEGLVDGIITEDSDLLVFGCKTVLYKLDKEGHVQEFKKERLPKCKNFRLDGMSQEQFRHMAILSGCDYLPSIPGIGLKSAHSMIRKWRTATRAIGAYRLDAKFTVPRSYDKDFQRADLTFQHQYVYDPRSQQSVPLHPFPPDGLSTDCHLAIGGGLTHDLAHNIAIGQIDPTSKEVMIDIHPDQPIPSTSRTASASKMASDKTAAAAAASSSKDIRNFFGPSTSNDRKPLGKVPVNRFKGSQPKPNIKEMLAQQGPSSTCLKKTASSRFFGGGGKSTPSVQSVVTICDEDSDADEIELVSNSSQTQQHITEPKQEEDPLDAETVLRTPNPLTPRRQSISIQQHELRTRATTPSRPPPVSLLSPSSTGSITSPEAPCASKAELSAKNESEEGDSTHLLTDESFHFTSPLQTGHPSSSSNNTSPPTPRLLKPDQQENQTVAESLFRAGTKRQADPISDIEDLSDPPAQLRSPPSKRRKSEPVIQSRRVQVSCFVLDDEDEQENDKRSQEAAVAVAVSLRERFSFSGLSSSSRSKTNRSMSDARTGLARAVSHAVDQTQHPSGSCSSTRNRPRHSTPVLSNSKNKPSAKLKRMSTGSSASLHTSRSHEGAHGLEEKATHWKKVDITSSSLAKFRRSN